MIAITHTQDLAPDFFAGIKDVAEELRADAKHMLCVMMSEGGVSARAHNPLGHASGLIQFMPQTLLNLGWRNGHEAFRQLSATEQLPYVLAYFSPFKGSLVSVAAFYTATFLPALVSHAGNPDFVLSAKNGPLGWAYGPNSSFDANRDMAITVGELDQAVRRNCVGPRWAEIINRLMETDDEPDIVPADALDLRTTRGIQCALCQLGIDPGPIDGIPGTKTRLGVMLFQREQGLDVDGIVGPITREALFTQLRLA